MIVVIGGKVRFFIVPDIIVQLLFGVMTLRAYMINGVILQG